MDTDDNVSVHVHVHVLTVYNLPNVLYRLILIIMMLFIIWRMTGSSKN